MNAHLSTSVGIKCERFAFLPPIRQECNFGQELFLRTFTAEFFIGFPLVPHVLGVQIGLVHHSIGQSHPSQILSLQVKG